jgi:hypothetical protein
MNTTKLVPGLNVKSTVKAAGWGANHNRALSAGFKIKSSVKAAGWGANHNRALATL